MAISGERLAVVGRGSHTGTSGSGPLDLYYGSVAILDISHPNGLSLRDLRDYPYPISGSATSRDSSLWGIVPTTAGKFVVVGDARYRNISSVDPSLRGKNSVATLGIAPDRIFGNGLE